MAIAMPEVGDLVAEKYRIERHLGSGGMGTVFCATHLMTGRPFALKWMNPDVAGDTAARERFIREFQTAGSITHPNVAAVLDVGLHADSLFIVMEYLEGMPLAALIEQGPMTPGECIPIVVEAMRGVAAAHERGIVHRDLKPENIFVCRGPDGERRESKVLDFGIVKAVHERRQTLPAITQSGTIVGTPPYMAPEQVMALEDMDHRVDIYAFGVILYEALSGRLPFTASTVNALMVKIATENPAPLSRHAPGIPSRLEAVVMKALARDPRDRFPDLETFARALKPFGHSDARAAATPSGRVQAADTRRSPYRRYAGWLLAAVVLAVLAAGSSWVQQWRAAATVRAVGQPEPGPHPAPAAQPTSNRADDVVEPSRTARLSADGPHAKLPLPTTAPKPGALDDLRALEQVTASEHPVRSARADDARRRDRQSEASHGAAVKRRTPLQADATAPAPSASRPQTEAPSTPAPLPGRRTSGVSLADFE